ncbi:hypothetical protein CR205_10150 [Alteribacter lacisalsi]|uniref:2TM domain-containing protein n=1 Tax=Alteribacter lacisalsi TaxID=2045244 RepID=A0A2W0HCJ2_9BACI|nr:hypothetical protein [Alteribacter lacisalsi]PYZ98907.1 hypothetical protein CR205_10150 [Alteribacter lacisalsi]
MNDRKERMRALVDEGRWTFIWKEGILNFALKIWLIYLAVSFVVFYNFDFRMFLMPEEWLRLLVWLGIFLVMGIYWGFIWFSVHSSDKKREAAARERKEAEQKSTVGGTRKKKKWKS